MMEIVVAHIFVTEARSIYFQVTPFGTVVSKIPVGLVVGDLSILGNKHNHAGVALCLIASSARESIIFR